MDLKTRLCTITPSIGPIKSREEDGKVKLVGFLLKHYLSYTGKLSLVKGDIFFPIQSYFKEKLEIILYVQGTTLLLDQRPIFIAGSLVTKGHFH